MLLVGQNGRSFVASALSTHDPAEAIQKVQQSGALRDPDCEPLLGLLDHMGQSRAEVCGSERAAGGAARAQSLTQRQNAGVPCDAGRSAGAAAGAHPAHVAGRAA